MNPLAVLRTIWRQKWFALPAIAIAIAAAVYVYTEGPRTYEATMSYALVSPQIPTEAEIEDDPGLGQLNDDNPYLRSTDPNLVANVVMTRLNGLETADRLEQVGLSTDYVASPGMGASGSIVSITASGSSEPQAIDTARALGGFFEDDLHNIQTVNGADESYLYTTVVVAQPDRAIERISSRLRTMVVIGLGGVILTFGAISLGTWVESIPHRRFAPRNERAHARSAAQAESGTSSDDVSTARRREGNPDQPTAPPVAAQLDQSGPLTPPKPDPPAPSERTTQPDRPASRNGATLPDRAAPHILVGDPDPAEPPIRPATPAQTRSRSRLV